MKTSGTQPAQPACTYSQGQSTLLMDIQPYTTACVRLQHQPVSKLYTQASTTLSMYTQLLQWQSSSTQTSTTLKAVTQPPRHLGVPAYAVGVANQLPHSQKLWMQPAGTELVDTHYSAWSCTVNDARPARTQPALLQSMSMYTTGVQAAYAQN